MLKILICILARNIILYVFGLCYSQKLSLIYECFSVSVPLLSFTFKTDLGLCMVDIAHCWFLRVCGLFVFNKPQKLHEYLDFGGLSVCLSVC